MFGLLKRILTQNYYNKKAPKAFEHFYKYSVESEPYLKYCNLVHKVDFPLQNNASPAQLKVLTGAIEAKKPSSVLDLGCGSGHLLNYLQGKYNFSKLGIDFALLSEGPEFLKENFETSKFNERSFDLIYSIDSLYMMNNLRKIVRKALKHLNQGGEFIIFYTSTVEFDLSPLSKAIKKLDISPEAIEKMDYTKDDKVFWENSAQVLEDLKSEFYEEGNISTFKTKFNEAKKNRDLHEQSSLYRYIVRIKK